MKKVIWDVFPYGDYIVNQKERNAWGKTGELMSCIDRWVAHCAQGKMDIEMEKNKKYISFPFGFGG